MDPQRTHLDTATERSEPMTRDQIAERVAALLSRPVRWASPLFYYDGCERTLQVFNADVPDQLEMLRQLEPHRPDLEKAAGGPIVVMFFSRKQSVRHLLPGASA